MDAKIPQTRPPHGAPPAPDPGALSDDADLLPGQRWTTLEELGYQLPCAVGPDRSYRLKPQTLGLALERGRKVTPDLAATPCRLLAYHLAVTLESLQGKRMDSMSTEDAVVAVKSLPSTSVLTMLVRAWMDQRGSDRLDRTGIQCPRSGCGFSQNVTLRVGQMKVRAWDDRTALPQLDVEIVDGLAFPTPEQRATVFTLEPAPWDAVCGLSEGQLASEGEETVATLERAIVGVGDRPGRLSVPRKYLEGLSAQDASLLSGDHDLLSGGPLMSMVVSCRRCGRPMPLALPWTALGFFGRSVGGESPRRRRLRVR